VLGQQHVDIRHSKQQKYDRLVNKLLFMWSAAYFTFGSSYRHFIVMLQRHMGGGVACEGMGKVGSSLLVWELVIKKTRGITMTTVAFVPVGHTFLARITYLCWVAHVGMC
jgi:hypothetical protein